MMAGLAFALSLVAALLCTTSIVLRNWITIRAALRGVHRIVHLFIEGKPWT